ncbi:ribonuclease-domain-containing protein [Plenodomus tracheiphilus IPT5]|uniref:ribonuclease T1 n=1 Tax=Plenodomus tracheiphilus IPT5 TaxID=1408161 RepID=A0A6A7BBE7_9PLEO|nr:ribonuclease-domain-containing protein [Plenodomus tracheiphilus IPT5]
MKFPSLVALLLAPIALALPTSVVTDAPVEDVALEARQSCAIRCGSTCYTLAQATSARNAGYNYYQQGDQAGSSTYPHTYNNYEGFSFLVSGPYQEFPLRTAGVYTGGSPGADRVIFNTRGQRAGEITHTGASGNNFVACSGW